MDVDHVVLSGEGATPAVELLLHAVAKRATDVHLNPHPGHVDVRFRIDGRLTRFGSLEHKAAAALLSQLKLMADLDIAEPFRAKEGRLQLPAALEGYQVRITTAHSVAGESAALRILDSRRLRRSLDALGFSAAALTQVRDMLKHGEGLILVTGPTNSGKTTTVYSMLNELDNGERNIVTIEDPVEYSMPSFCQLAVDPRHDLSMAAGLRTLLRMDPDVVLVGEIRDAETADVAMRAASSGKRVLSTFHTRDVASTITAFRDLHADNRSLAGNLAGVVSQRLVRRVCSDCCRREAPTDDECQFFERAGHTIPDKVPHAVGCAHCGDTGYYERIGVFEVAAQFPAVGRAITEGAAEDELRALLRRADIPTLIDDALDKTAQGLTTLAEVESMTWANTVGGHVVDAATCSPPPSANQCTTPPDRAAAYRVVVFAAPDQPELLRDRLVESLGMHPTDAMIQAQRAPGILPALLTRDVAEHFAEVANAAGLRAEAISQKQIPDFAHAEAVHHLRCHDDGLEIVEMHDSAPIVVAWTDVALLAVGRIRQEEEHTRVVDTPVFSYRRLTPNERLVRQDGGLECWLVVDHPLRAYRVDHSRLNYEYLGERKTDSATQNFRYVVDDILSRAPSAYVTPSTRALVEHGPPRHYEFDSSEELRQYATFHLLIRRRAERQAKENGTTTASGCPDVTNGQ